MPGLEEQHLSREQELKLAQAVVRGDREALNRFHALHSNPLYRFVFYRLGGKSVDAEEVVQETFLAALESMHRFRGASSLLTWLCAIAKNRIFKLRRRQSRERLAEVLESADPEIDAVLLDLEKGELPQEVLEKQETHDLVGATMASLPLSYQSVLADKYIESLSVKEIARRRRTTAKAVESTLSRARGAFRHVFELLAHGLGGKLHRA